MKADFNEILQIINYCNDFRKWITAVASSYRHTQKPYKNDLHVRPIVMMVSAWVVDLKWTGNGEEITAILSDRVELWRDD